MSAKVYAGSNTQSDKHAARCLSQCYFQGRWDMIGHVFHSFWIALMLSVWMADPMYEGSVEDMFYNSMLAYYLACANVAMLQKKHGKHWDRFFVPLQTFVHSMIVCGQFAGRCSHWPCGIPFMNNKTSERVAEIFFGWAKMACKGMPRSKDMIYGSLGTRNGKLNLQSISFQRQPCPIQSVKSIFFQLPIHMLPIESSFSSNFNPVHPYSILSITRHARSLSLYLRHRVAIITLSNMVPPCDISNSFAKAMLYLKRLHIPGSVQLLRNVQPSWLRTLWSWRSPCSP